MPANYVAHDHDFLEIALVVSGSGMHRTATGCRAIGAGDVLILRPGAWHAYDNCRRLLLYNSCLGDELFRRELAWLADDPVLNRLLWSGPMAPENRGVVVVRLPEAARREVARCWKRLRRVCRAPAGGLLGRVAALVAFLEALSRGADPVVRQQFPAEPRTHPVVTGAMRLLEGDLRRAWGLGDLVEASRVHPAYLIRLFKAHTGLPPMGYLARCRVERAAMMLSGTDLPVKEVAEAVGWPDQNYFSRRFRGLMGVSPTGYRRRLTRLDLGGAMLEPEGGPGVRKDGSEVARRRARPRP